MTEEEIIQFVNGLPETSVLIAGPDDGSPEVAWGDAFFTYRSDRQPFATIVIKNYPGFDTASDLDRPGVFRLNVAAGRAAFERLLGYPPEARPDGLDYTVLEQVLPHPVYAAQGWVCVLNPGEQQARSLVTDAHARAAGRHRR
ncbi:DUF6194 family protein [Nonomuraea sp. NPDC049480]|uniref:DUF6194 family protein n=1 Tax=Nonomuraea sp. NPDC049480 TaxID=3364353 RepID=UPI0037A49A05